MEEKIDKTIQKLERKFASWLESFEKRPIKNGIKVLILLYILKKIWKWIKD